MIKYVFMNKWLPAILVAAAVLVFVNAPFGFGFGRPHGTPALPAQAEIVPPCETKSQEEKAAIVTTYSICHPGLIPEMLYALTA